MIELDGQSDAYSSNAGIDFRDKIESQHAWHEMSFMWPPVYWVLQAQKLLSSANLL